MTADPDLLVIGGGPAGSTIAALSAEAGVRVTLVERARFPRGKVCGEFLSAEGCRVLERAGLLDRLLRRGSPWMTSCRITGPAGSRIGGALPDLGQVGHAGLGVSRELLDSVLLEHARRRGVRVLERREAIEAIFEAGRVAGLRVREVGGRGRVEPIRAKIVIAADGHRSLLARRLHPRLCEPTTSGASSWFGLKAHLSVDPAVLRSRVELHMFDGGYAGLGAIEERRINLCCIVRAGALQACDGSPARVLKDRVLTNPALRETIGEARPVGPWRSVGPLRWGVRRPASHGVLFVGDAAGTIDPFCGEGMSHALRSAEIVLPFLRSGLEQGGLSDSLSRGYTLAWKRNFAPVTRRVRALGRVLGRPTVAGALLRLLGGPGRRWVPRLIAATRTGG